MLEIDNSSYYSQEDVGVQSDILAKTMARGLT